MPVNEKTSKCKGFTFRLVPEHVQKEILKLNEITLENRITLMEDATSIRKRDTQNWQKTKRPHVVTKNTQKISMYSTPQNFQLE